MKHFFPKTRVMSRISIPNKVLKSVSNIMAWLRWKWKNDWVRENSRTIRLIVFYLTSLEMLNIWAFTRKITETYTCAMLSPKSGANFVFVILIWSSCTTGFSKMCIHLMLHINSFNEKKIQNWNNWFHKLEPVFKQNF